jgi:hypothetical protein
MEKAEKSDEDAGVLSGDGKRNSRGRMEMARMMMKVVVVGGGR